MKETAVDYLFQKLWDRPKDKMVWYYIFEKAKRMEKEQIIQAASTVLWNNNSNSNEVAEQYYKETYGKNA